MKNSILYCFITTLIIVSLVINTSHSEERNSSKVFSIFIFDQFITLPGSCSFYTETLGFTSYDSQLNCEGEGITTEVLLGAPCDARLLKYIKMDSKDSNKEVELEETNKGITYLQVKSTSKKTKERATFIRAISSENKCFITLSNSRDKVVKQTDKIWLTNS